MRIVSGIYKNRRVNFKKLNTRPTTDFAKESLFNVLENSYDLSELSVLDLFAGSGNISYEFTSRGCQTILAIENNIRCFNFIKKMKSQLNMLNLKVQLINVYKYLKKTKMNYDIIFADPPYNYTQSDYNQVIQIVFDRMLLTQSGTLIIEHSKLINFQKNSFFSKQKKYGKVNFTFLKYEK